MTPDGARDKARDDYGKSLAWHKPKSIRDKKMKYYVDYQEKMRYLERAYNGEQYV